MNYASHPVGRATVIIAILAIVFQAFGDPARELLQYHREAVISGEIWRFVTAHLVHLGSGHLALNLAGLLLVSGLLGREFDLPEWTWISGCGLVITALGFFWLRPDLQWYVGLSGMLHCWITAGALKGLRAGRKNALVLLIAILLKGFYEQLVGPLPGSELISGGPISVDAHWFGIVGGLIGARSLGLRERLTGV